MHLYPDKRIFFAVLSVPLRNVRHKLFENELFPLHKVFVVEYEMKHVAVHMRIKFTAFEYGIGFAVGANIIGYREGMRISAHIGGKP